jgi:flagellar basal body P-ring protein FlgI
MTPLIAPDGTVYALGQGALTTCSEAHESVSACVMNGGVVVR